MNTPAVRYKRHRFPPQIISHAVWLNYMFPLSLRPVEEILLERAIVASYEAIRRWAKKFGPNYARCLRRKRPSRNDIWHLEEFIITIAGQKCWLWRAALAASVPDWRPPFVRQAAYSPDAVQPSASALSPVTASIAVTIAAFNLVSAREWSHDGAMTGAKQARCSSVAALMNGRSMAG